MKLNRKPPFANTAIDPEKSRAEIDHLLQEFGAEAVQWTTDWKMSKVNLKFMLETEIEGVKKRIGVDINPAIFAAEHRSYNPKLGRSEKVVAPNWAQSMRLLYWWLKSKLEAVAYGMTTAEQEFLSQVMTALPTGERGTIGEFVLKDIGAGKLLLPESSNTVIDE